MHGDRHIADHIVISRSLDTLYPYRRGCAESPVIAMKKVRTA